MGCLVKESGIAVKANIRFMGLSSEDELDLRLYLFFAHNIDEEEDFVEFHLYDKWVNSPEEIGVKMLISALNTEIRGDKDYSNLVRLGGLQS